MHVNLVKLNTEEVKNRQKLPNAPDSKQFVEGSRRQAAIVAGLKAAAEAAFRRKAFDDLTSY